jgi:hypothetical protein
MRQLVIACAAAGSAAARPPPLHLNQSLGSSPSTTPTPQHFSTPLPPTLQQVHPPHFTQPNPPALRAPPFLLEQGGDPPISVAAILVGQHDDPCPQSVLVIPLGGYILLGGPALPHHSTSPAL